MASFVQSTEEVIQLRKELQTRRVEKPLKKKTQSCTEQAEAKPPPFVPKEIRMTEGFERFFEGKKNAVPFFSGYEDWYADISKRMENDARYIFQSAFFLKISVENQEKLSRLILNRTRFPPNTQRFISDKHESEGIIKFNMKLLEDWTYDAIKFVLILHPKDPYEVLEMDKTMGNAESWTISINKEHLSSENQLIVCGRKM